MPEAQQQEGDDALERLTNLLSSLGWRMRGDQGVDIPCTLPTHDRDEAHGVDGYATYPDPYQTREQGVFIESKSRQWGSINSSFLTDAHNQLLKTVECAPLADEFDELLDFGEEPRAATAGVLGVWCNTPDEFQEDRFRRYVRDITVSPKRKDTYRILILGNSELERLAAIHNVITSLGDRLDQEENSFKFFYPSRGNATPKRLGLPTLERLASDFIFLRAPPADGGEAGWAGIFYSGDPTLMGLKYAYQAMQEYQLTDCDAMEIHHFVDIPNPVQEEFKAQLTDDSFSIEFRPVVEPGYWNYTANLDPPIGENHYG